MRLRSQLIVAFLVLAIVPLAGVVGYTYWSNVGVLKGALESEASQLTESLENNMQTASADLRRGLVGLGHRLKAEDMSMETDTIQGAIAEAMESMGPVADSIAGWRFGAPEAPPAALVPKVQSGQTVVVAPRAPLSPRPVMDGVGGSTPKFQDPASQEQQLIERDASAASSRQDLARRRAAARERFKDMFFAVERDREGVPESGAGEGRKPAWRVHFEDQKAGPQPDGARQAADQEMAFRFEEIGDAMGRAAESGDFAAVARLGMAAADVTMKRLRLERLLGAEWTKAMDGIALVPDVDIGGFIKGVLEATERKEGEIAFAADTQGNLFTVTTEDYDQLAGLVDDQADLQTTEEEPVLLHQKGWLIAHQFDSESGLTFGIAKPYAESFEEIRARTGQNLLLGFGMIGFSLLGILPLSSRLTRRITRLSEEAERLASGDLEARVPVKGRDELGQLAQTFNRMASRLQTNQRQMLDQELENQRQEAARTLLESENRRRGDELEAARKFQLSMLPERLPDVEEFEVAVYHETATEVGGDYYDFAVRDDAMTIALGDATGHGARAATLVTVIRTLFLNTGATMPLARFLNSAVVPLRSMSLERMAMSMLLVRLDRSKNRLTLASAGMPPAYRLRGDGVVEELECHAVPLGAMANVDYREVEHDFEPGDTLVLLSDGLPEQADANGDPIGYERLVELIRDAKGKSPAEIVETLRRRLEIGTGGGPPSDDVTLVAVRRN